MKHILKFFFLLVFTASTFISRAQNVVRKYINKYQPLAVLQMKKYQIPASVILGVSIVESGAGQSKLARIFNNHFGIKGPNKDSRKKLGYKSAYRQYANDTASYEHFCRLLQGKKFYDKIKGETDYNLWLKKMNEANYSVAKDEWVRKVRAAIRQYKLHQYDEM